MTDEELNEAIEYNLRYLEHDYSIEEELEETMKCLKETQQELLRKDNNWNELKKYVDNLYEDETYHSIGEVLDKIEELESK